MAYCAVVITAGFTVRGGAGFGGGALATPLLALVLPLKTVLPVVVTMLMLASIGQIARERRRVDWREVLRVLPFMLVGVLGGLYLLATVDSKPLSRALGVFVVCYSIYALVFAGRMVAVGQRWVGPLAAVLGLCAGFAGALFGGAAGPLYVMYLNALRMEKDRFRASLTFLMAFQGVMRITGYATLGFYNAAVFVLIVLALPMLWLGNLLGDRLVRRFDQRRFDFAVSGVLLLSGAVLILR